MPRPLLSAVLASIFIVGCGHQPTPAEPETSGPGPTFDAADGPLASGATLVRAPFQPGVLSGDVRYAVAVGFEEPFAEHCNDLESPDQPGSTQIVFSPSGRVHVKGSGKEVNVRVYEFPGVVGAVCDLVGEALVAIGTVDFNLTVADGVSGAVHVGVKLRGVVELVTGGLARLHATGFTLLRPDGSFAFDHVRITLRAQGS
jgi:hypothetical protein